uniref:7TM_GPCR_Srx domain-containing protein n=1 Tax=Parastrongyloides trichosuri TaxID=131310 RepID=A0A0N4ZR65_PARTI
MLRRKFKRIKNLSNYVEQKKVHINLTVQSLFPCLSNFPVFGCLAYQMYVLETLPFIIWRICDFFHYLQYSISIFITLMFIKEIKKLFFTKINIFSKNNSNTS